jgi:UDP-N-acetylglucosamine 3-dehydrogenase
MTQFKVGVIGCGHPWRTQGATGFGQGHIHVMGYKASQVCKIVSAADIRQDNLDLFCQIIHFLCKV